MSAFTPFFGPFLFSVFADGPEARLQGRLDATPLADAYVRDGKIVFHVDLPGVTMADLAVAVEGQWLTVSAERSYAPEPGDRVVLSERPFGKFERRFRLPNGVDGTTVEASLRDGVLTIAVPAPVRPTTVEVKVSLDPSSGTES